MRRFTAIAVAIVATLLVAWGALHVFIAPVNPAQSAPTGHYQGGCWACHMVVASAPLVE